VDLLESWIWFRPSCPSDMPTRSTEPKRPCDVNQLNRVALAARGRAEPPVPGLPASAVHSCSWPHPPKVRGLRKPVGFTSDLPSEGVPRSSSQRRRGCRPRRTRFRAGLGVSRRRLFRCPWAAVGGAGARGLPRRGCEAATAAADIARKDRVSRTTLYV